MDFDVSSLSVPPEEKKAVQQKPEKMLKSSFLCCQKIIWPLLARGTTHQVACMYALARHFPVTGPCFFLQTLFRRYMGIVDLLLEGQAGRYIWANEKARSNSPTRNILGFSGRKKRVMLVSCPAFKFIYAILVLRCLEQNIKI